MNRIVETICGCALMSAFVLGMGVLVLTEGWGAPW